MATLDHNNSDAKIAGPDNDPIRERAIRLFRYLAAVNELRSKKVRDISAYEAHFWFRDLPRQPECCTLAWRESDAGEDDCWLAIKKPIKPALPKPPVECRSWFKPSDIEDISKDPVLLTRIVDPAAHLANAASTDEFDRPTRELELEDHPEVKTKWTAFVEEQWHPWQREVQRWETVQRAYRKLFAIYQEQERRGEQYELIIGVGALVWTNPAGHRLCRPVVTVRAAIKLEQISGRITVGPIADGAEFKLEQDMLEVTECPPIQDQERTKKELERLDSIWNRGCLLPILKGWLHSLHSAADAAFFDALDCPERASQTPQMAFAPVLILRRTAGRTMRDALRKIVAQLEEKRLIPEGIRHLCGERRDESSTGESGNAVSIPEEVLFPLPANDEQSEIVDRVRRRSAVLVQGPPGTGKSHTIVNLVSHFLAAGKRVLVTSQTPRALQVLHDKFPDKIRPLIVSLLGEDSKSRDSLESSVQGILRYVEANSSAQNDPYNRIEPAKSARRELIGRLAQARRRLHEAREIETRRFEIPDTEYRGTASAIAKSVALQETQFSWLADSVPENGPPPLSDFEFGELLKLWEDCKEFLPSQSNCRLPEFESLPSILDVENAIHLHRTTKDAVTALGSAGAGEALVRRLCALDHSSLDELRTNAKAFLQCSETVDCHGYEWTRNAKADLSAGRLEVWKARFNVAKRVAESVPDLIGEYTEADLEVPQAVSQKRLLADASALLAHLKTGAGLGFWIFRSKTVRECGYLWRQCRFAGKRCDNIEAIVGLVNYLTAQQILNRAWHEWSAVSTPTGETDRSQVADFKEKHRVLRLIDQMRISESRAKAIFSQGGGSMPATASGPWAHGVLEGVMVAEAIIAREQARYHLDALAMRVTECCRIPEVHSVAVELIAAVSGGDAAAYQEAFEKAAAIRAQQRLVFRFLNLEARLRSLAPVTAGAVINRGLPQVLADRPDYFSAAWRWKRASAWLERFASGTNIESLHDDVRNLERQLADATKTLIEHMSWSSCIRRMGRNAQIQGALRAWQDTVRRIGAGTGKHVESDRRTARKYMQMCRSAIPAWIMPLYRVVEQVDIEPEIFDIVIVDEASQTGPEGLILQYLAKQCIVVGDDKQISPESGFINREEVQTLIEQHLTDIPFAETLDVGTSLFSQAAIRYGHRTVLREHFRCMPEIINFSNQLCYRDTPLMPLRPYSSSRLPPLMARFVVDGYREGQSQNVVNRPEAAAIVKTLLDCLADKRYTGKSFGVICLQGRAQSQLIESLILDKLGPDPFKDKTRRLLCGDPYSFQGDERDVIFLSMVAATEGDGANGALVTEKFRQRFNVSASRARDQMWLFHSIREADLNPNCMRRRLLTYVYNPSAESAEAEHDVYDSKFERDVAGDLRNAGYRVFPQFEVAGRKIDLVAEGDGGRIAVECDGDEWHGPDEYDADMARQRMLERCGWTFCRIRGSSYYANRQVAFQELIRQMAAFGVKPLAAICQRQDAADWVAEISGNQCVEALGAYTVNTVQETIVQQADANVDGEGDDPTHVDSLTLGQVQFHFQVNGDGLSAQPVESNHELAASKAVTGQHIDENDVTRVIYCLLAVPEPLSRAQIMYRARIGGTFQAVAAELIRRGLVEEQRGRYSLSNRGAALLTTPEISEVLAIEPNTWLEIARWATEKGLLTGWQRGVAQSLSFMKRNAGVPTPWQIQQGKAILVESSKLGFSH